MFLVPILFLCVFTKYEGPVILGAVVGTGVGVFAVVIYLAAFVF